jgi:spermidine synthase
MARFAERSDLAIGLDDVEIVEIVSSGRHLSQLLRHHKLGLVLTIDDVLQHAEAWQALYHEPLVHLAAAFVPEVKSALVLGGGSLFAARELLRYPTLERCVLVDHDPAVLQLMARHYPHARAVLSDERFIHVEDDAMSYMRRDNERFDLIANDALDLLLGLDGPHFNRLSSHLKPYGACADVVYRHLLEAEHLSATRASLTSLGNCAISLVVVPEYPGALHALTLWGNEFIDQAARSPINTVQQRWCTGQDRPSLEFYDPRFMQFHLYLPPFLRRAWGSFNQ